MPSLQFEQLELSNRQRPVLVNAHPDLARRLRPAERERVLKAVRAFAEEVQLPRKA